MAKSDKQADQKAPAADQAQNSQTSQEAPSGDNDAGPSLIRKISAATVLGNVKKLVRGLENDGDVVQCYRVIGMSHGIRTGTGDNGAFVAFLGTFEATNYFTGEVFRSGQCFVPKALEDILMASIKDQQKGDPSAQVSFAIEVGLKRVDAYAIGYEYVVKSLVKPSGADPLEAMRNRLPAPPKPTLQLSGPAASAA